MSRADAVILDAIRKHCRVVYYPDGEPYDPKGPAYPIEHNMAARKDMWAEIVRRVLRREAGT